MTKAKTAQTLDPNANIVKGSIFNALNLDPEEADQLSVRAGLMSELISRIDKCGLNQTEAAELLGVTQPRISSLKNGEVTKFSLDMLFKMLSKMGARTVFKITDDGKVYRTFTIKAANAPLVNLAQAKKTTGRLKARTAKSLFGKAEGTRVKKVVTKKRGAKKAITRQEAAKRRA